ncbi:MAG TPA: HIT family protein [Candidatus Wunengus californicus]|uniref:HIT family protein n=1 Tax=Candidatus Wunengus californicus TaxID=3367619 RepID=UPI004029189B
MNDCTFCKIVRNELPSLKIDENEEVVSFLSLEGHPLIVPKKHIQDIYSLDKETGAAIMEEAIKVSKAVKKGLQCDGINLVQANEPAAKQDVFHFHLHVKPRWHGDGVTLHWPTEGMDKKSKEQTTAKIKQALA